MNKKRNVIHDKKGGKDETKSEKIEHEKAEIEKESPVLVGRK